MFLSTWVDIFQVNLYNKTSHEVDNAFFFTPTLSEYLIEHSVHFRSYAQLYTCLLSFSLPCSTMRVELPSFPSYRWTSWGLERVNNLAEKWQLGRQGRIWTASEEFVIAYEGRADTTRGTLTISPKALGSGLKNEYLGQLLLLQTETTKKFSSKSRQFIWIK